jgi:hypothetical protein
VKPDKGGTPLPPHPICLPRDHAKAAAYVLEIETALTRAGWSGAQRAKLRGLLRLWVYRAEGRDPHFEQYGSFARRPGSQPPTVTDAAVAKWRRLIPLDKEARKRRRVPWRVRELTRERDRYK